MIFARRRWRRRSLLWGFTYLSEAAQQNQRNERTFPLIPAARSALSRGRAELHRECFRHVLRDPFWSGVRCHMIETISPEPAGQWPERRAGARAISGHWRRRIWEQEPECPPVRGPVAARDRDRSDPNSPHGCAAAHGRLFAPRSPRRHGRSIHAGRPRIRRTKSI